ncbi:MAG: ShlB/FhaC/HecB family hemolysin secretion/activation protein [Cyanosarcina radialis HA8281-LM2]|nr:ShlB/FhaC/HecB family hemolysin secretion/activation protein [Cyanosarcina radialis HA8281-LM2]
MFGPSWNLSLPSITRKTDRVMRSPRVSPAKSLFHSHRSWFWSLLAILTSSIAVEPLNAQTPAPPPNSDSPTAQTPGVPPPQDVLPLPSPAPAPPATPPVLPPSEELLAPPASTSPTPELMPGEIPGTVTVERFEVVGSTAFSPEELAAVTQPFTGRSISLSELFQARTAITELYQQRGYITSGAYIPPQKLQGGVVKIQVVEGSLAEIRVTGTRRLNPNYIRSRIARGGDRPLNRQRLLETLQLLQLNPLIENISAELSAGIRPGESLLAVKVTEADTTNLTVALDNGRSPSVGTFRRRLQFDEANFLGQGDGLSLAYINTDGSNALEAIYTFPLNPQNATLGFSYATSAGDVIEPPFNELDINSNSRAYELTFRQPLVQTPTEELAIGLRASRQESEASLFDGAIPFPVLGADNEGRTRVSALRFFQQWTKRDSRQVIALQSQFSFGLDAFNSTINKSAPDSRFFAWRGQGQWVRLLAPDTLLLVGADVQLADRALVPAEQIGLGGLDSVRGYRQDVLLTDNAAFASAEVRFPILRVSKVKGVLQLTPFVDFGTAWNNFGREDPDPNTLASVGLGLRWQQGDRFSAQIDWGIPLISVDDTDRTWQENGLYFSSIYSPF